MSSNASNGRPRVAIVVDGSAGVSRAWRAEGSVTFAEPQNGHAAPCADDYAKVFAGLADSGASILSLHPSASLSESFASAQSAAALYRGQCDIRMIDTGSVSLGVDMIARKTAQVVAAGATAEAAARVSRVASQHVYAAFATDELPPGVAANLERARGVPVKDSGMAPVLALEDGRFVLIERVRSFERALERVADFAAEFDRPADLALVSYSALRTAAVARLSDFLRNKMARRMDVQLEPLGTHLEKWVGPRGVGVFLLDASEGA